MNRCLAILAVLAVLTAWGCNSKLEPGQEAEAVEAAKAWLLLVDNGEFEGSWHTSAEFLKESVTKEKWVQLMEEIRKPMGVLVSRKVSATEYRTMLPKAMMGQYVIIEYETSFANKPSAGESITQILEKDGSWRVGGYHLK